MFRKDIGKEYGIRPCIVLTLLRQIVFLIPLLYLFPAVMGINGVFMAQPVSDLLALVLCILLVIREQRTLYAKLPAGSR